MGSDIEEERCSCAVDVVRQILEMESLNDELREEMWNIPDFVNLSILYTELSELDENDTKTSEKVFSQSMHALEEMLSDRLSERIYEEDIILDGYIGTVVQTENPIIIDNGTIPVRVDQDVLIDPAPRLGVQVRIYNDTDKIGLGNMEVVN